MFTCLFCGLENPSEKARFCVECGPDGPAKNWAPEDIDKPSRVTQYASLLSEIYFEAQNSSVVEKFSLRIRERLQISHGAHASVLSKLAKQKKAIAHLSNFRFEFNENVIDAYAGHDTFLNFRYTNLSDDDLFKVSLYWDDPDTSDRIDLKAETKSFVKPMTSVTIGASAVFDRIGIKELSDLQITITDQFGESANFRAEAFVFKVGNHDQKITQNISTHNQISIEGRGVVDASGMGTDKASATPTANNQPKWKELTFSYLPAVNKAPEEQPSAKTPTAAIQPEKQITENREPVQDTGIKYNKDDLFSVLKAAEQGNAAAQNTLGDMYVDGIGVAKDNEKAVHWYRMAAAQADAFGQNNLGLMYQNGLGVAKDDEKAVHWYRLAAEQGNASGQCNLGFMYENGLGVANDNEKAVHWYRLAAAQGNANGQNSLGHMYLTGMGVAVDNEKAVHWYRLAAEQGDAFGQNNLGFMYQNGLGVATNNDKATHWYQLAARQGNENAIESLKGLQSPNTPAQPPTNGHGSWDYGDYTYTGMFKDGQWNGLGELVWAGDYLGHRYVGNFVNGLRHGQGTYTFPNGVNQVGLFENNVYQQTEVIDETDNFQTLTWDDGSTYYGEIENGRPHGFGTFTFTNGDSMYGVFVNGTLNDETAHYDFADGGTYDGQMVNGQFRGHGTRTFGGDYVGHRYVGNFENGYFNGEGIYYFPDGSTNVGQFKDGTYVVPTPVEQNFVYVGATLNGIAHGVGKMTWKNGDVYKGDFVNGIRHGLGELTYANGTQLTGRFENNEFIKKATFSESFKIGFKTSEL